MTGPDVWTQASIDFFCPDPESPDYLAALFRRAHYYGNTKGMGAVDLAIELGHTGGNKPESIPEMATPADTPKSVSTRVADYSIDAVAMPNTYTSPTRPNHCRCANFGDKVCQRSCDYGIASFLPVDCGNCDGCNNWYRYQIAYRYDRGTSGRAQQTLIRITELDTVGTAATIASGIGKRDAAPRHKAIGHADGGYWVQIAYADALDAHSVYLIELAAHKYGYNLTLESDLLPARKLPHGFRATPTWTGSSHPALWVGVRASIRINPITCTRMVWWWTRHATHHGQPVNHTPALIAPLARVNTISTLPTTPAASGDLLTRNGAIPSQSRITPTRSTLRYHAMQSLI